MARGSYVSLQDIDAGLFGEPHQGTISYLRERVERYAPRAREVFDGFFEDARELFERHNGEAALRRIRATVRRSSDVLRRDVIRPLRTIDDLQKAKPIMQRYVMANIMMRLASEAQTVDGYSDSYMNPYPGRHGWRDPDYMRSVNGMIFTDDEFGIEYDRTDNAWVALQDAMGDDSDERDLDIIEQSDIMSTWRVLEMHLAAKKKDPSSILNENM